MYIGADYYPEHWQRKRWPRDAELMQKAGFNVVRLAEFAWAFMEPEEGKFDFSLFDEALEILGKHGVSALMCTPTAVMPAWVARKYPETLATQKDGTRIVWGVRKNNCFTSGTYRLLSERITRAMAEHYADTPNVIGWQTDNEFGHPVCYCDTCRSDWQDWLRRKYGTLDELNRAWGTHFWGHLVSTWGEIVIPVDAGSHNPSACLDWQRYFSWLNVRFQREQVNIIRTYSPHQFITHNFMGLFPELNYYDLAEDLDFVSWDNYPVGGTPGIPYDASAAADLMRGLKRKNFWIMEETAGAPGWGAFARNARPGEIRKVAYQQLAHGADGQVWFRWRTCTAGREQYWHGLLGHDGKPLRRYKEAARTAQEYHKLAAELEGTTLKPKVAMIYDYDSLWAVRIQPGFAHNNYHDAMRRYYSALFRAGVNVDMIPPGADFTGYRAVLAPDLYLLPDKLAERLNDYVKNGGVLLTDCRTGVKDETSLCYERTLPGLLTDALGIVIEEYESLTDEMQYAMHGEAPIQGEFTAVHYVDWATPKSAGVLAGYDQWHMKKFAAATRNEFGKGAAYYVGTRVKEETFYDALISDLLRTAGVRPAAQPPAGVEITVREGQGRKVMFVINHTEEKQTVKVPAGKKELISGSDTGDTIELDVYGVAVVRL